MKDYDALMELAKKYSDALDEARTNMEETGQKNNTRVVRYAKKRKWITGLTNYNTFPQYDEGLSDANTQAEFWARNPKTKQGDWRIATYRNRCYTIFKEDNNGYGYIVRNLIPKNQEQRYYKLWEEQYGRSDEEAVASYINEANNLHRETASHQKRGSDNHDDVSEYSQENQNVFGLGEVKNGEQQSQFNAGGSDASSEYHSKRKDARLLTTEKSNTPDGKKSMDDTIADDREYMAAVESGDTEAAQRMVDVFLGSVPNSV